MESPDQAIPHPSEPVIRKATARDVPAVAATLARAFYMDPIMSWIFPDARRRLDILRAFFGVAGRRLHIRHDETYVAGDMQAAAVWDPPGTWKTSALDIASTALPLVRVMKGRVLIGLRAFLLAEKKHPPQPVHYYLAILGTDPPHQGKGIGSALLATMLSRTDAESVPAYLEASSEDNKRLYQRHGFKEVERVGLPGGGPPFWRMWRDVGG